MGRASKKNKKTVLFLAADPSNEARLRLGEEHRSIQEKLQLAANRDTFKLEPRLSVRIPDITQAMLDTSPHIVHFAGHGTQKGDLCFEDATGRAVSVTAEALGQLFKIETQVECVVLNACYSRVQAEAIAEHVAYVIGMQDSIKDAAAIAFTIGFYQALGAGKDIETAFEYGLAAIRLHNIPDHLIPVLLKKRDILTKKQELQAYQPSPQFQEEIDRNKESEIQTRIFDKCLRQLFPGSRNYDQVTDVPSIIRLFSYLSEITNSAKLWWTQGYSDLPIDRIKPLQDDMIVNRLKISNPAIDENRLWLIEQMECYIDDVWVYRNHIIERQHIVVKLSKMPRFDTNEFISDQDIVQYKEEYEESPTTEYAYFRGEYISINDDDDGYTIINDEVVEIEQSDRRRRNLGDDFIIIAPELSVFSNISTPQSVNDVYRTLIRKGNIDEISLKPLTRLPRPHWMKRFD